MERLACNSRGRRFLLCGGSDLSLEQSCALQPPLRGDLVLDACNTHSYDVRIGFFPDGVLFWSPLWRSPIWLLSTSQKPIFGSINLRARLYTTSIILLFEHRVCSNQVLSPLKHSNVDSISKGQEPINGAH